MGLICAETRVRTSNRFKIRAKTSIIHQGVKVNHAVDAKLSFKAYKNRLFDVKFSSSSDISSKSNVNNGAYSRLAGIADITSRPVISGAISSRLSGKLTFSSDYTDKIGGHIQDYLDASFESTQKLYPASDISGVSIFNESGGTLLSPSIDEGIYLGDGFKNLESATLVTDDITSYIQPSSMYTGGSYSYSFYIDPILLTPDDSFFLIRAAGPKFVVPPNYKIHNITLSDPSGNTVVTYDDINIRGDADFDDYQLSKNFATYISPSVRNRFSGYQWNPSYHLIDSASGYYISFDIEATCNDDPFSNRFNFGYQDSCELDTHPFHSGKPVDSLRISAIEIISNGSSFGRLREDKLDFITHVGEIGERNVRRIYPVQILDMSYTNQIYPSSISSTWISSSGTDGIEYINNEDGSSQLVKYIRSKNENQFITLDYTQDITDSGKLFLKFSHEKPNEFFDERFGNGPFNIGYDVNYPEFDYSVIRSNKPQDTFFTIESIELKVIAKKAVGGRDYSLDVVGYSDDKILNVTSKIGGFLQNIEGSGSIPLASGNYGVDDLGISTETISDKDQYYEIPIMQGSGSDHYLLSTSPIINTEDFAEYTIPLKIYDNADTLLPTNYTMSSYFENLYLDIFPIPSGASIARIYLNVYTKPTNAFQCYVLGSDDTISCGTSTLLPYPRNSKQKPFSFGNTFAPLSVIENIPQSYSNDNTLKTNYARRWRGMEGFVFAGPYDANSFDFSFFNPQLNYPFNCGYFGFENVSGNIISHEDYSFIYADDDEINYQLGTSSGIYVGNLSIVDSLYGRFNASAGHIYRTIDWTQKTGNENDPLYGKIADSFHKAVYVSGQNGYINFGDIPTSSGFAIFARFSPLQSMSGVSYNLYDSGILFSKYDSGSDLEFALGLESGKFTAYANSGVGQILSIQDLESYDTYSYPLSIALTYNDNSDNKLRLYIDNEISSDSTFNTLRAISEPFSLHSGVSDLTFGYSDGYGIGVHGLFTDIGISTPINKKIGLTSYGIDKSVKQSTVDSFFDSIRMKFAQSGESHISDRYKLWSYVNEDTSDWHIGAFMLDFNQAYDGFTKRQGASFVFHRLSHDGSSYVNSTDLSLPVSVPSGLAYHTQLENDMLRFNLGYDNESFADNMYSPNVRISKNLPRGYNFLEDACSVETILQVEHDGELDWSNGNYGPKLIVSLYTTSKDSEDLPGDNLGLVTRDIHYLEKGSGNIQKVISLFDYHKMITDEEAWATFDNSQYITELNHKYFSKDIEQMFLQYDLAYPSGSSFTSEIKIHSCSVKFVDSLIYKRSTNDNMPLVASGEYIERESLDLYINPHSGIFVDNFPLSTSGSPSVDFAHTTMFVNASYPVSGNIDLYIDGTDSFKDAVLPLKLKIDEIVYDNQLELYVKGDAFGDDSLSIDLYTHNFPGFDSSEDAESMNLFLQNLKVPLVIPIDYEYDPTPEPDGSPKPRLVNYGCSLFINAYDKNLEYANDYAPLFTKNYPPVDFEDKFKQFISWDSITPGTGINANDERFASIPSTEPIRGVDLLCFGSCVSATHGCIDERIVTHEIVWYEGSCSDGGIMRPRLTYTNLDQNFYNDVVPYSGHFYDIRKYTGLVPNTSYSVVMAGHAGSSAFVFSPRDFTAWDDSYKFVGDNPFAVSGRQEFAEYGHSADIIQDLAVVGAPYHNITDTNGDIIENAGSVFIYRRDPPPTGFDWTSQNRVGEWQLEDQLQLPDPILRDSYTLRKKELFTNFFIDQRIWSVGQDGRNLGYDVSIAKPEGKKSIHGNDREIIVASGPSCAFTREFEEMQSSGVNVALFVFTDRVFRPEVVTQAGTLTYLNITEALENKDLEFRYLSDPPVRFNIRLAICQAISEDSEFVSEDFRPPKPNFIIKKVIDRHTSVDTNDPTLFAEKDEKIFTSLKEIYHELFPYDTNVLNNNIPPLLGVLIDNSASLGAEPLQPALDNFISYYKDYAFASGLYDFYGVQSSGFAKIFESADRNWVDQSISALNSITDMDTLEENDALRYFSSGILENGNTDLGDFNVSPPSGGAVYLFEKEYNDWNLIQIINSDTQSNVVPPDRFGHSVDISKDGTTLAIGSPYSHDPINVYIYNENEKLRVYSQLYSWILFNIEKYNTQHYKAIRNDYIAKIFHHEGLLTDDQKKESKEVRLPDIDDVFHEISKQQTDKEIYLTLSKNDKYDLRTNTEFWNNNIPQEFQLNYTYEYKDITYKGNWKSVIESLAPTSRLGYSVSVSDDGRVVAAGAPTDSLDEYDHTNSYFNLEDDSLSTWPSYVNTGAVRIFEARNYYPHNKVVEYGKFGNIASEDSDYDFSYIGNVFSGVGIDFAQTTFSETNIPQDAGLAFIIAPKIDFVNDTIVDKIKDWLSLGDRNLVIVGNDPYWEANGKYYESNKIINKLLHSLGSRMELHAARTEYDSLSYTSRSTNTIKSFTPNDSLVHEVNTSRRLLASGVADIRIHWPKDHNYDLYSLDKTKKIGTHEEALLTFNCSGINASSYYQYNDSCPIPLSHGGDLRSQWFQSCGDTNNISLVNWPSFFNSGVSCVDGYIAPTYNYAPVPLLAAAETKTEIITFPDIPETSGLQVVRYEQKYIPNGQIFGNRHIEDTAFSLVENENTNEPSGLYKYFSYDILDRSGDGVFFNPDEYNDRNALIQAKGINDSIKRYGTQPVCSSHNFAMMEPYSDDSTSTIFAIASLETEKSLFLDNGVDTHRLFYTHLARKLGKRCTLAQLGGWTGRSSFKDASSSSFLKNVFIEHVFGDEYIVVDENVSVDNLLIGTNDSYQYDVCWIANPTGLPNETELNKLRSWLSRGNKKLFITYDRNLGDYTNVSNAKELLKLLNSTISPIWLPEKNRYAISITDQEVISVGWHNKPSQIMPINPSLTQLASINRLNTEPINFNNNYIPMCGSSSAIPVAYSVDQYNNTYAVLDSYTTNIGVWRMDTGLAKVEFETLPSSGYTVFIDVISENELENQDLRIDIHNATLDAYFGTPRYQIYDLLYNPTGERVTTIHGERFRSNLVRLATGRNTYAINFQTLPNTSSVELYIQNAEAGYIEQEGRPRTVRIASISGCLTEVIPTQRSIPVPVSDWVVFPAVSGFTEVIEDYQAITHPDTVFCQNIPCNSGDIISDIESGPVIAAQELEVFSTFANGFNRSRITVLSDIDLISQQAIFLDPEHLNFATVDFMRSLYPSTEFPKSNALRQYNMVEKIKNLELGSPARFFNAIGNSGINLRFQTSGVPTSGRPMLDFVETIDEDLDEINEINNITDINQIRGLFVNSSNSWGSNSKFAGYYNGTYYEDENVNGGMPQIMIDTNKDYLDLEYFVSGYPGDLFGYSVSIDGSGSNIKILVGSPFSAYIPESITRWQSVIDNSIAGQSPYNTLLSHNGGAGSAYLYEKTLDGSTLYGEYSDWSCTQKFRPESINVGQDLTDPIEASGSFSLGPHDYTAEYLTNNTIVTDQFGKEVLIVSDLVIIGAPGHDFDIFVPEELGDFYRREFTDAFGGGHFEYIDMGLSGNRDLFYGSGNTVLNNGAIYTYEYKLNNFQTVEKEWTLITKTVPNGYNSRDNSENNYFGDVIAADRVKTRSDSDYSMIVGTPIHEYATDAVHISPQPLTSAGCAYFYDAFLSGKEEVGPHPDNWIQASLFGDKTLENYILRLSIDNTDPSSVHTAVGTIYSNSRGEIFVEASGQDFNTRGFIVHRPYISAVYGQRIFGTMVSPNVDDIEFINGVPYINGVPLSEYSEYLAFQDGGGGLLNPFNLHVEGRTPQSSGDINLSIIVPDTGNVYNNMNLTVANADPSSGILPLFNACAIPSGLSASGFILHTKCSDPLDYLTIFTAGY